MGIVINNYKRFHTLCRHIRLHGLYKKYGFDKWHFVPVIYKPYIKEIKKYINSTYKNGYVVEIGCGLCDILGGIEATQRLGVDMSIPTLNAAKELHPEVDFLEGTFDDIKGLKIDTLIAVNFTHNISDGDMETYFKNLIVNNSVRRCVLDEVTGDYKYKHDYLSIIKSVVPNVTLVNTMGPYRGAGNGERYIKVFEIGKVVI